jgi:hypothetical protein
LAGSGSSSSKPEITGVIWEMATADAAEVVAGQLLSPEYVIAKEA